MLNEVDDFRKKHNNKDIYTTVYRYNMKDQNESALFGPMYFDLDNTDLTDTCVEEIAFEEVREDAKKILAILEAIFYIPQEQIEIYFSGGKGLHILVAPEILGIIPSKDLNNVYRSIAVDVKKYLTHNTLDTKIYDNKRLFRIPNSIHGKTNLYKIPLTASELRTLSFSDIKLLATKPRSITSQTPTYNTRANRMYYKFVDEWEKELKKIEERKNKGTGNTNFKYTPPCVKRLLDEGVKEGSRNNTIAVLASFFKQSGLTEDECINRMNKFNSEFITPSLNAREVERTVTSIYCGSYKYGCRSLIDMGLCESNCKIAQKRLGGN